MRILFMGLPLGALFLIKAGIPIEKAILCRIDATGQRRLIHMIGNERVWIAPKGLSSTQTESVLREHYDLLISWFWTKKISIEMLQSLRIGAINAHPSLLPRWRGPDPYFWPIYSGDAETGVSVHWIHKDYDSGPLIAQTRVSIPSTWNSWQLARGLDLPSLKCLLNVTTRILNGDIPSGETQNEQLVTHALEPNDEILAIDWQDSALQIERLVRAAAPYPGAFTWIGDNLVVLTEVLVVECPKYLQPGEACAVEDTILIAAREQAILLKKGRLILDDDSEQWIENGEFVGLLV